MVLTMTAGTMLFIMVGRINYRIWARHGVS